MIKCAISLNPRLTILFISLLAFQNFLKTFLQISLIFFFSFADKLLKNFTEISWFIFLSIWMVNFIRTSNHWHCNTTDHEQALEKNGARLTSDSCDKRNSFYDFHVVSCVGEILKTHPIRTSARLKLRRVPDCVHSFCCFVLFVECGISFSQNFKCCVIRRMVLFWREVRGRRMLNNCIPQKKNVCISCEKCVRKEFCEKNQLLVGLKINGKKNEKKM